MKVVEKIVVILGLVAVGLWGLLRDLGAPAEAGDVVACAIACICVPVALRWSA